MLLVEMIAQSRWFDELTTTCTQLTVVVPEGDNRLDPNSSILHCDSVNHQPEKSLTLLEGHMIQAF
jgi:hypothetical protein